MKKSLLFLILLFGVYSAFSQTKTTKQNPVNVPTAVETRFSGDNPNTKATWSMDGKYYVASFKDQKSGMGKTVTYDKMAVFIREDIEITAGYPGAIDDYCKKKFPKEKYTVWASYDDFGEPVYYIKRKGKIIWFNKNGTYSSKKVGKYKN